ncbi:MAG: di-trans,poly-cis-decaprenylcistransferase [Oscillospiraceae bacterium]|nr:di-trans,poly-cis-decaprenylcistransferase [Oscillospiraceae bacterium]
MSGGESKLLPRHVGIIMDGNGRWAKQRGLPRTEGHKAGVAVFERICEYAADLGVPALTFYAFSTENWVRSAEEVAGIMELFRCQLQKAHRRAAENEAKRWRIRYIGDLEPGGPVPADIIDLLRDMERKAMDKDRTVVNIAVNYGGRQEILRAARRLAVLAQSNAIAPAELCEQDLEDGLYTAGQPPLDLIIRPSGEQRLSNFMLWQSAYAELWFSDVLWPDFTEQHFDAALAAFVRRGRRFGATGEDEKG